MHRPNLWAALLPALFAACGCDAPTAPPPPPPRPAVAPLTCNYDQVGLSLQMPTAWRVAQGKNDILFDVEAGKSLVGRLSWTTGGTPMDVAANNMIARLTAKFGKVTVLQRSASTASGPRLDMLVATPLPVPQRMVLVVFHHRGRLFNFTISSLEPEWKDHEGDVDSLLQSIVLKPGQVFPAKSSSHSFEFDLPEGWTFEPVEPPEGPIVARFWAAGGFPCGQIMSIRHDGNPQPILDQYFKQAPRDWALKVIEHTGNQAVFAHTLGTERYQTIAKIFHGPAETQWFQIWTSVDDFPARKAEFDRAARSYKYYLAR